MANSYDGLDFDAFRRMAVDPSLSSHEKIGFPDSYRAPYEQAIFRDIATKLTNLAGHGAAVLDIGPGCAGLPHLLIDLCRDRRHRLCLVDSAEMLAHLPDGPNIAKVAGFYPDCAQDLSAQGGPFDVILCYSVFHYVFAEASFWRFLDCSMELLAAGGQMLIGDIPNTSKRKRFFTSAAGIKFHQDFMKTTDLPPVEACTVEKNKIDDSVIMAVLARARAYGCDAYWLPQAADLPMGNRREDILIVKP